MHRVVIRSTDDEHQMLANQFFQANIRELARHLPPSGEALRLVDVECGTASVACELLMLRPDLQLVGLDIVFNTLHWAQIALRTVTPHHVPSLIRSEAYRLPFAANSADAIVAHRIELFTHHDFLSEAQRVLRPGGRLIVFDSSLSTARSKSTMVQALDSARMLDSAGYARVLGERGVGGYGVLVRGEKPYQAQGPMHLITPVDTMPNGLTSLDAAQLSQTPGRYVFLLIRQTPNRPVWSLAPETMVAWDAASAFDQQSGMPVALAFSSLPKAVTFMQPAVTANVLIGVTRIAKFDKAMAAHWSFPVLFNPEYEVLRNAVRYELPGPWLPIDRADAQTGDE